MTFDRSELNIIDVLTNLHDAAPAESGEAAAYRHAVSLIEHIENLNVLAWKLGKARDAIEEADVLPEYRESYLTALDTAHRLVLERRIDDE